MQGTHNGTVKKFDISIHKSFLGNLWKNSKTFIDIMFFFTAMLLCVFTFLFNTYRLLFTVITFNNTRLRFVNRY